MEKDRILSKKEVEQKLQRIARELLERFYESNHLTLVGIANRGVQVADKIHNILTTISTKKIDLFELSLDKDKPFNKEILCNATSSDLKNKNIVLIDDVLNSGRTLMHAASYLLKYDLLQLTTVVLVDRKHRLFPIKADFVGMTLSTTLKAHISVETDLNGTFEVYLD